MKRTRKSRRTQSKALLAAVFSVGMLFQTGCAEWISIIQQIIPVIQQVIPVVQGVMGLFDAFSGDGPVDFNQVQNSAQQIGQGVVGVQDAWGQFQDSRDAANAAAAQDLNTLEGMILRARDQIATLQAELEAMRAALPNAADRAALERQIAAKEDEIANQETGLRNLERQFQEAGGNLSDIRPGQVQGSINVTTPVYDPQDQDTSVHTGDTNGIGDTRPVARPDPVVENDEDEELRRKSDLLEEKATELGYLRGELAQLEARLEVLDEHLGSVAPMGSPCQQPGSQGCMDLSNERLRVREKIPKLEAEIETLEAEVDALQAEVSALGSK